VADESNSQSGGERRGNFRGRTTPGNRVDLRYRRADGKATTNGKVEVDALGLNLGVGGIFLLSLSPEPVGSALKLHLSIPGDDSVLRIDGDVCWVRGGDLGVAGMGIQFGALDSKAILALRNYFSRLS